MTLEEIYIKTMASEDLKKSFAEAAQDKEKLDAWLKSQGCDATLEELGEFFKKKSGVGEVSDEDSRPSIQKTYGQ